VPTGTTVQMTVATQVETVLVPDVHGLSEANAISQFQGSGLQPGERATAADPLPVGYVVTTEPRAGSSVTRGSPVDYTVSSGPAHGQTPGPDATPRPTPRPTPATTPKVTPTPFPSAKTVLVTDYTCLDLSDAREHVEAVGLLVGAVIPEDPAPGEDWIVQDQLPKPGATIPVGSKVDLMLGDPLDPLSPC
jgi:beta-lactam-binding protein with PASTA domain